MNERGLGSSVDGLEACQMGCLRDLMISSAIIRQEESTYLCPTQGGPLYRSISNEKETLPVDGETRSNQLSEPDIRALFAFEFDPSEAVRVCIFGQ